ncbi:MAG: ABC transporter substrate-binding protein [Pararhodobacter sp.]|nr:ABC transporter substrate-binding protein [Pararhodobacter sp.]
MKLNRRSMLASSAAALAVGSSLGFGTGRARASGVHDDEIVIGTHLDLSGPVAAGMPMLRNAMQMRIDRANEAGGIHGRRIRLIVEDNGSQPQLAVRAAQKLIRSDEVFGILNPFGSGTNAATVGMATEAGRIVFAPWAASNVMQQVAGNSPYLFTTVQNYHTTTGRALAWAINEWGVERIGVIYQEGPFGDLIRGGVTMGLAEAGAGEVVAEAAYRPGDIDFSSQVARMRAAGVELVIAGTIIRETVGVMSEVKKLDWDGVRVLTAIPGRATLVARLGGDEVEGLYGIGGWQLHGPDTEDADARAWLADFAETYGVDADENAANAWSYTSWFIDALEAAGRDLSADSFVEAARATRHADFTTFTELGFEDNHAMPELVRVDQVQDGRWVPLTDPF